jgi:tripartite-type tricarboxylate transporter receptor subunit TctC
MFRLGAIGEIRRALAAIACLALLAPSLAGAQTADDGFYKGKTVRIVVGYGPGGGYDIYARMIAPYVAKALGATVVVENQPGAGGITALNRIMTAPPDGLQMMLVNGLGAAFAQLTEQQGVRFDLAKLSHLGTVSASPWVWLVGPNATIDTPQKALDAKRRFMWSASGPIDGLSDGAAFSCEALNLDCGIVLGYPGSNEAALAVAKGEMDMIYVSDTSANNYVKAGQNKAVATMGRVRSRFFPDTPTIFEAVKLSPEQAQIFDFHSTAENLGRILVAPPDLPAERLAALRNAVRTALSDPALVAEGEKTQRYVDYIGAEETRKATVSVVVDPTPQQKKRMMEIIAKAEKK